MTGLIVGCVVALGACVLSAYCVYRANEQVDTAMRLLRSRDYPEFASASSVERKERPKPPTPAQLEDAVLREQIARAEADPYSQG